MTEKTSVLLVEDDPLLRESLGRYLGLAGFSVTSVPDGLSYYRELADRPFAVAVVDLGLPDQDGAVLVDYTRRNTKTKIIVVTARDNLGTRVECYEGGADLFLGKPVDVGELAAAIRSLAGRHAERVETVAPAAPTDAPGWVLLRRQRVIVTPAGRRVDLTSRQARLLEILADASGQAVARRRLQQEICADAADGGRHALDTLVRRTRTCLADVAGGESPILTEHGVGYLFTVPVDVR